MSENYGRLGLKEELEKALVKIKRLENENEKLRRLLEMKSDRLKTYSGEELTSQKVTSERPCLKIVNRQDTHTVNSKSSPQEKIALFRDLFKGREDVFALRWTNKDGKSGYSPACKNDWKQGICGKFKKISCSKCKNRNLIPLSDEIICQHLKGEIVIGLYPLLPDERCYFLAIDFDKEEWKADTNAFQQVCRDVNIPSHIEISRSGNGAHIWFFFTEHISAKIARELGFSILSAAMSRRHRIGLDSYDRLFPNQDSMPIGGFGNLIALPLQKKARLVDRTVFIDENFRPIKDQWSYLAQAEKVSLVKVKETISALKEIAQTVNPADKLPAKVNVTLNNMVYLDKKGLSASLLNQIIKLASFPNPEYYRAQALRLPVYNKPKIISLASETTKQIAIPRGCYEELKVLFKGTEIALNDETYQGIFCDFTFKGKLTEEQAKAASALIAHNNGILSASTAFGKTVVALWVIAQRKTNTLIIVHRKQLLEQWIEKVSAFLNIPVTDIGKIAGGKKEITNKIDIAVIHSLYRNRQVKEIVKDYGMVVVDECHHIAAFTFEQVLKEVRAKYILGLTATPTRKDGHHPIVTMQCGKIRYKDIAKKQAGLRPFEHIVVVRNTRFTSFEASNTDNFIIAKIYRELIADNQRNDLIVDDIINAVVQGRSPLILTERAVHVKFFVEKLTGFAKNIIPLKGGMSKKQIQEAHERLKTIPDDEERVIVATGKYIGEGFDDKRLDTLFLTMPISWKGTLQQYAGRLHRNHYAKKEVIIYDYVDNNVPVLEKMFKKRMKGYKGIGYTIRALT